MIAPLERPLASLPQHPAALAVITPLKRDAPCAQAGEGAP